MEFVGGGIDLRDREVVALEEQDIRGDVALGEDGGWRFGVEWFEAVDAEDRVALRVRRERVGCVLILLFLSIFCSQLANLNKSQ